MPTLLFYRDVRYTEYFLVEAPNRMLAHYAVLDGKVTPYRNLESDHTDDPRFLDEIDETWAARIEEHHSIRRHRVEEGEYR